LDFIKWANDSGAAIDISHCSEKAALKVMELSNNVTCTHSFRKVLNGNPRGKSDKVFTLLAERNGCVGIPLHPGLIRLPSETIVNLETFCTHVKSLVDLIGVQHVCIGSDWVGRIPESVTNLLNETQERGNDQSLNWSADVLGFESFSGWGVLLNALRHSGMSNHEIEYIQGMSFIRSNLAQEKNE
jgi:membrane dipeptidase